MVLELKHLSLISHAARARYHVHRRRCHSSCQTPAQTFKQRVYRRLEETSSESRVKCSSWRREHKECRRRVWMQHACTWQNRYAKIAASSQSCDSIFRVTRCFPPQRTHLLIIISYAQRVDWTQGCLCPSSEQYPHKIFLYRCFLWVIHNSNRKKKKKSKPFFFSLHPSDKAPKGKNKTSKSLIYRCVSCHRLNVFLCNCKLGAAEEKQRSTEALEILLR